MVGDFFRRTQQGQNFSFTSPKQEGAQILSQGRGSPYVRESHCSSQENKTDRNKLTMRDIYSLNSPTEIIGNLCMGEKGPTQNPRIQALLSGNHGTPSQGTAPQTLGLYRAETIKLC